MLVTIIAFELSMNLVLPFCTVVCKDLTHFIQYKIWTYM